MIMLLEGPGNRPFFIAEKMKGNAAHRKTDSLFMKTSSDFIKSSLDFMKTGSRFLKPDSDPWAITQFSREMEQDFE